MPRHRQFSTAQSGDTGLVNDVPANVALAAEGRFATSPPRQKQPWVWLAALLLHAAVIALALISFKPRPQLQAANEPGVSVVFDNGGSAQNAAPPAQRQGPLTMAETPPPATPPPPAAAQTQLPEVNLNLPMLPQAPLPEPTPAPQTQQRQVVNHRPAPRSQYQVMNNMSFGNPAPLMPNAKHGLNLQLSQSDLSAMNQPEITVRGEIGEDWMDGFNKWVNDHTYYPQAAAEQGQQGTSTIEFTVHRDGHITGLHLLNSAGSPFLDQAWLGIFAQNNVPPFPPGTKSDSLDITASLHYEIIP